MLATKLLQAVVVVLVLVMKEFGKLGDVVMMELGKQTQLRKLEIGYLRGRHGRDLCLALEEMQHLHTLKMQSRWIYEEEEEEEEVQLLELESLISPPQLHRRLYLTGHLMRLPVWIDSLRNLAILWLQRSLLSCEEKDPLKVFQHMPNLVHLYLEEAYDGEELCCSEVGGYKNLKKLFLLKIKGLKRVRFMKGSMPMLRKLKIGECYALKMVPHCIASEWSSKAKVIRSALWISGEHKEEA